MIDINYYHVSLKVELKLFLGALGSAGLGPYFMFTHKLSTLDNNFYFNIYFLNIQLI